jgi:hypothetical protein
VRGHRRGQGGHPGAGGGQAAAQGGSQAPQADQRRGQPHRGRHGDHSERKEHQACGQCPVAACLLTVGQTATPRRRDRLRAATITEIKSAAMAQMASGGADTISLRGIARDMGMTPRAIYTYYDPRDDLLSALLADE